MPLTCQRAAYSIPNHIAYINCAYMGPLMRSVVAIGHRAVSQKAQPWEIAPTDFFSDVERLRKNFARLIGAPDPERIAVVPSVSYGLANVANNLHLAPGQNIVIAEAQFPSNVYPWRSLARRVGAEIRMVDLPPARPGQGKALNEKILAAIDPRTRMVTLGSVHWTNGLLYDLEALRQKTQENRALLVIDGSQSIGALPFDVQKIQPDALVSVGYKWLMGPYGLSCAWYGPAFDGGEPIEHNWIHRAGSEDFRNLVNYQDEFRPGAARYSMGEVSQFIHTPMLNASIEQILEWGVENIQDYCRRLTAEPVQKLRALGCFVEDDDTRAHHLFGIGLPGHLDLEMLKTRLAEQQVFVSFRGDSIRVAPNVYNTGEDLERFLSCFA